MVNGLYLAIESGPQAGSEFWLPAPSSRTIGRSSDCDIVIIGDPTPNVVSRHHCRIDITADGVHLIDLGSHNGTFVNGRQLATRFIQPIAGRDWWTCPGHRLTTGDMITCGGVRLTVVLDTIESAPAELVVHELMKPTPRSQGVLSW